METHHESYLTPIIMAKDKCKQQLLSLTVPDTHENGTDLSHALKVNSSGCFQITFIRIQKQRSSHRE